MRRFGMFLLGAILGGFVGGAAAILMAPASGENIRGQISDYSNRVVEDVKGAAQQRRIELERELSQLRSSNPE